MDEGRMEHELAQLGGAARWHVLRALGVTEAEARRAVRHERVASPSRGVYVLPGTADAIATAVRRNGLLTCSSAARCHGLAVLHEPAVPHLAGYHFTASGPRAVCHAQKRRRRANRVLGPPVVTPIDAVLDATRCLPLTEALVMADSALNKGLIRLEDLPRSPRGRHAPVLRQLREMADGRAESLLETLARVALVRAGLHVQPQERFDGVGRVDLLVEGRLVVELDGDAFHGSAEARLVDRLRDNTLAAQGLRVMRFDYDDVVHHIDRVVDSVRAAVSRNGH